MRCYKKLKLVIFEFMPYFSATVILRLSLIIVPIMSQRLVAKQQQFKPELDEFRQRIDEARKEGNNMLGARLFNPIFKKWDILKEYKAKTTHPLFAKLDYIGFKFYIFIRFYDFSIIRWVFLSNRIKCLKLLWKCLIVQYNKCWWSSRTLWRRRTSSWADSS